MKSSSSICVPCIGLLALLLVEKMWIGICMIQAIDMNHVMKLRQEVEKQNDISSSTLWMEQDHSNIISMNTSMSKNNHINLTTYFTNMIHDDDNYDYDNEIVDDNDTMMTLSSDMQRSLLLRQPLLCVYNSSMLHAAVRNAISVGPNFTKIHLCTSQIKLDSPLNVTNKRIYLLCNMTSTCTLNAKKKNRFIIGQRANLHINGINFMNGFSQLLVGAIQLAESTLTVKNARFYNNRFIYGSLISVRSLIEKKRKTKTTLTNVVMEQNIALIVLDLQYADVKLKALSIQNNVNATAIAAFDNTTVSIKHSSILNNFGLVNILFYVTDSRIVLRTVYIRNNTNYCLWYSKQSTTIMDNTWVTKNVAAGYPYSMLHFVDSTVKIAKTIIRDNNETSLYLGNLEFIRSNVSIKNTSITNNLADAGPNLSIVDSTCVFTSVQFYYNKAYNMLFDSKTMDFTNSIIQMLNTSFYGNSNSFFVGTTFIPGYFISSNDKLTKLTCDTKTKLCHDGHLLSNIKFKSNCTFRSECNL